MIDAQSIETTYTGGPGRGYDGGKNVKGRKRHVVVDTMGLVLAAQVHSAGEHESQTAPGVFKRLLGKVPRLEVIFADNGYEGTPGGLVWRCFGWLLEIVRRDEDASGFDPLEKRWVIERTFGWFEHWRRLSKDYEYRPETSEAMIGLAMSRLMINRLR